RRPRQLPAGDPHRVGQAGAAPDQPLQEQRAGTGPPRPQGPLPAHARLQVPEIGRPVLPRSRRAPRLPPPPLPPQPARPRRPPPAPPPPDRDRAGYLGSRLTARRLQLGTAILAGTSADRTCALPRPHGHARWFRACKCTVSTTPPPL